MSNYRDVFPKRNTFLAVIHVQDEVQALRNAGIAFGEGADGIFLINHSTPANHLRKCFEVVRCAFPQAWIGLNWLDSSPLESLDRQRPTMQGMWIDDGGITEDENPARGARLLSNRRTQWEAVWKSSFVLFGGVAFKYQQSISDPGKAAKLAVDHMDVVTTSGEGTGYAPAIEKIRTMKKAIGTHPLAIASGMTPENIHPFLEHADCFLVATGISDSYTELSPARVRELSRIVST